MIDIAPHTPSMEDFSDHIAETVSLGVCPKSVFQLPDGCSLVVASEGGPDQLLIALSKHDANAPRAAPDSLFLETHEISLVTRFSVSPDQYCGFVASTKERDSFNTDLGLQLAVVLEIHFSPNSDTRFPRIRAFCRVNAYNSRALLARDFTAIRVGSPVSGLVEKALSNPHTAHLVACSYQKNSFSFKIFLVHFGAAAQLLIGRFSPPAAFGIPRIDSASTGREFLIFPSWQLKAPRAQLTAQTSQLQSFYGPLAPI